jgi:HAD superfamily phosphoserine phosphatase-like hydrolase
MTALAWPRLLQTSETEAGPIREYLLISDFDQTLTFDDSGVVLSRLIGATDFERKVAGLARINLVQQGGELTYLLLHDPEYRCVRREHLIEVGKRIRLKDNLRRLVEILDHGIDGHQFLFYVISASPEEVIQSALEGIVPPERIYGTRLCYNPATGEIESGHHVSAGYGKVAALAELQASKGLATDRVVYVGDGSSDVHAMLHINRLDGYTIAVSEGKMVGPIARRTILCEDALGILVPILEDIVGWRDPLRVRMLFEEHGFHIREWDKVQTDAITIREGVTRA